MDKPSEKQVDRIIKRVCIWKKGYGRKDFEISYRSGFLQDSQED